MFSLNNKMLPSDGAGLASKILNPSKIAYSNKYQYR